MLRMTAALVLLTAPSAAMAAVCPTVPLTNALRQSEAARVSAASHRRVPPTTIDRVIASGPWRIVWATPAGMERGVYFFRGGQLVDTWGGVLIPQERQDGVRWAMQAPRRVPAELARCFADVVVAGH